MDDYHSSCFAMKWTLFFAFQLISYLYLEVETKQYHEKSQNIKKCLQFQCPAFEDPICVKVKRPNTQGISIFIRMINKCELSYMKCQPEYSAIRVSMKNCGHFDPSFTHKRSKRSLMQNEVNSIQSYHRKISNLKLMAIINNNLRSKIQGQNTAKSRDQVITDEGKQKLPLILSSYENGYKKIPNSTLQSSLEESLELPSQNGTDSQIDNDVPINTQTMGSNENEVTTENCIDEENNKTSTATQEHDGCSEQCPVPKSMVCARMNSFQTGVYSTFLSVCHLRVYSCRMKQKYELVSREPCVLNFGDKNLENPLEEPASNEEETDPLDPVLRFVRCTLRHQAETEGGYILLRDKECLRYNLTQYHTNHYQKHFPKKPLGTSLKPENGFDGEKLENRVDGEPNEYDNDEKQM